MLDRLLPDDASAIWLIFVSASSAMFRSAVPGGVDGMAGSSWDPEFDAGIAGPGHIAFGFIGALRLRRAQALTPTNSSAQQEAQHS